MSEPIIIFGASARAAAASALRAGLAPWCADLFADADLCRLCSAVAVTGYPHAFADIAKKAPSGPWLYTGALENHPRLVDAITQDRPLWGNCGSVLRALRSPRRLTDCLHAAQLPCPTTCERAEDIPRDRRRWLVKPLASAGGHRVALWDKEAPLPAGRCYWQEFIEGDSCAALFIGHDGHAEFLGASRQLVGLAALHAKPFAYCGSIGPLPLSLSLKAAFTHLGSVLASSFGLRGLFGVDCILRDEVPWPVEVNPRYTASVEVLELALGIAALAKHRMAFAGGSPAGELDAPARRVVGKAILFAAESLVFPTEGPWLESLARPFVAMQIPTFADIPHPGQRIENGQPILSVFAAGPTFAECQQQLAVGVHALACFSKTR